MKTSIYNIFIIGLLILILQSCQEFLDTKPYSQSIAVDNTDENAPYYKSGAEVEAALGGVYNELHGEYFFLDYFVNGDVQSDDAYAGGDNPNNFQIDDYNINATNENVSRDWADLYRIIGYANQVINNTDQVTDLTETRKKQIIGEASFLRAFAYFQAVQLWNDIPLQLTEVKTISAQNLEEVYPLLFPARSSAQEVYSQIILDLETALGSVRNVNDVPDKQFVTVGAVNALLAKVYATIEPHDWDKVKQYCNAVIAGPYTLLSDFNSLWDNSNENSAESIFENNCYGGSVSYNWGPSIFVGLDWKKFNTPSLDLAAAYDAEGDMIRKNASMKFLDVSGKWSDQHWPQTNFPFINKYHDYQTGFQNYIYIRLADIILLKAEALNESGDTPGAAALVNLIRNRVGLANTTASSKETMRLAIEKERRLELAFEGLRWYDLKRTGRAIEVINAVKENGNNLYNLTPSKLFWPIPQSELDKNSKLTQNEGY